MNFPGKKTTLRTKSTIYQSLVIFTAVNVILENVTVQKIFL